jgi:ParB family chromosome partitioning protein
MATKKLKGLGRGLEALLGGDGDITPPTRALPSVAAGHADAGR